MSTQTVNIDRAGKAYWDEAWEGSALPEPINPRLEGLNNYVERRFHKYFSRLFGGKSQQGQRLLEVGCARSTWQPYFAKEFGFSVSGLDYSEVGCEQSRVIMQRAGLDGDIVHADFNDPPVELLGSFDVLTSWGVVEHFEKTAECVAAFRKFLKPGGMMITIIPNMTGSVGFLQRILSPATYDVHVPLDRAALHAAHQAAGLTVDECDYFLAASWSVVNMDDWNSSGTRRVIRHGLSVSSKLFWLLEQRGISVPANRLTSPYVVCLARN